MMLKVQARSHKDSYFTGAKSIQSLSCVWLFVTPWTTARQASLSFTISWSLLKLMSIESVMPSNHHILCRPLRLLPSIFIASLSFAVSQLFTSGGQSIGVSASASVLPVNIQGWFPLRLTGLISLSKGLSRVFSNTTVQKHQFLGAQPSLWSSPHMDLCFLIHSLHLSQLSFQEAIIFQFHGCAYCPQWFWSPRK